MARRRRRRQPDAFDLIEGLLGPIAALLFVLLVLAPLFFRAVLGFIVFIVVVVACVGAAGVLFAVIWKIVHSRKTSPRFEVPLTKPRDETSEAVWISEAIQKYPRSDWERYGPKPVPEQNLQQRLRAIDWFQFEKVVSAIYEVRGCKVKRLGGANPDGGIDLIVENGAEQVAIQCKHWKKWTVKLHQVRELLGALTDVKIKQGVMVTLCGCTQEAREFANKHGIVVVEEDELVKLMQMEDGSVHPRIGALLNDKRKFCPKCESPMVERVTERGFYRGKRFWGCSNFPRCKYILRNA